MIFHCLGNEHIYLMMKKKPKKIKHKRKKSKKVKSDKVSSKRKSSIILDSIEYGDDPGPVG